jgi:hypothetical protein
MDFESISFANLDTAAGCKHSDDRKQKPVPMARRMSQGRNKGGASQTAIIHTPWTSMRAWT